MDQAAQGGDVEPPIRPEVSAEHDDGVGWCDPRRLREAPGQPLDGGREGRRGQEAEGDDAEDPSAEETARRAAEPT